jgi:hypothetical protein
MPLANKLSNPLGTSLSSSAWAILVMSFEDSFSAIIDPFDVEISVQIPRLSVNIVFRKDATPAHNAANTMIDAMAHQCCSVPRLPDQSPKSEGDEQTNPPLSS